MRKILNMAALLCILALPVVGQTVQVGDDAPEFSGTTFYGKDFSLHETVEDSIIVVYFMGYS